MSSTLDAIYLVGLRPHACGGLVEALSQHPGPVRWVELSELPREGTGPILAAGTLVSEGRLPAHRVALALMEEGAASPGIPAVPMDAPAPVFRPLLQLLTRPERLHPTMARTHWHRPDPPHEAFHGPEHPLEASDRRFRRVLEHSGEGMGLLGMDGVWHMANPAAERLFGLGPGGLLGRNLSEFLFADQGRRVRAQLEALEVGSPATLDCAIHLEEGSRRWLWATVTRLPQEHQAPSQVFWVFRDVTERRRALNALANSEARLKAAIASAPILLLCLNREGQVTLAQGQPLALLEVPQEDLVGRTAQDLEDRLPLLLEAFQRGLQGDERPWTLHLGSQEFMASLSPLPAFQGHPGGWILTLVDITDRRRAERAAWNEEKLRSLVQMAGGAAHDFNNLFQTLQGRLELAMTHSQLPPPVLHHLREAQATLSRASRLSSQLLQFSGGTRYSFATLQLVPFLLQTLEALQQRGHELPPITWDIPAPLPPLWADANALRQVVGELVYNALEAGESAGPLAFRAEVLQVLPHTLMDAQGQNIPGGDYVLLELRDRGPGIPADVLRHIFDPFFSTKLPGRGLGLPAVLGILQSHGAAIQVDSRPGEGTRVRLYLPAEASQPFTAPVATGPTGLRRGLILVVDDEKEVRQITRDMLELLGRATLEARDGREAVDLFRQHRQDIDLVILDMTMPVMSGQEAFQAIHDMDPTARVIIASGYAQASVWQTFEPAKPLGFLQKPYGFRELEDCLQALEMTATCS